MKIQSVPLLQGSVGTARELTSFHFGDTGGQKIYIQASLHADETPTMLVALHLKRRLAEFEQRKAINAEIVLVPVANPIGLDQILLGQFVGRFDLETGRNFNRDFPELNYLAARKLLGTDAIENRKLIREALNRELADIRPRSEFESLRLNLMRLSIDADVVLDLHCSLEAVMHLYANTAQWEQVEPLARYLGAEAALLTTDSGGNSFDETHSLFWWNLKHGAERNKPIPDGCVAVTIECRGQRDVSYEQAEKDADAIINFLIWRGALIDEIPEMPALISPATPLAGSEQFYAPVSGVLVHRAKLGALIKKGDALFDIVDPLTGQTNTVCSNTEGIFYMRRAIRFVHCGNPIGRVSGSVPIRAGKLIGL
ncbi:MAG: succinylglutamate desuccinylase/aspartoacylase family protein [Burkholderiaceae bacterium]|nr:succinylglutamate desuccinylase/aspartoacylase family protein [Burkholderiaceae bacterium]